MFLAVGSEVVIPAVSASAAEVKVVSNNESKMGTSITIDQFLDISDSIEDFFHSCFREMGMPEWANWAITNVIMILLPI